MENNLLEKEKLHELALQLRCPEGSEGIAMGDLLWETNKGMIQESIRQLPIQCKDRILELGYGNGAHVGDILAQADYLRFFGMEISNTMKEEALRINRDFVNNRQALFSIYDGIQIPYVERFFQHIFSVNTIYFWQNAIANFKEMYRVLKPNGTCVITFAAKSFMKELPFVTEFDVFELYNAEDVMKLIEKTPFKLKNLIHKTENVQSKTGIWVERDYTIVVLTKEAK